MDRRRTCLLCGKTYEIDDQEIAEDARNGYRADRFDFYVALGSDARKTLNSEEYTYYLAFERAVSQIETY